jgi:hypothetical protein
MSVAVLKVIVINCNHSRVVALVGVVEKVFSISTDHTRHSDDREVITCLISVN